MARKRKEQPVKTLVIGLRGDAVEFLEAIKQDIKDRTGVVAPNTAIILAALKQLYASK